MSRSARGVGVLRGVPLGLGLVCAAVLLPLVACAHGLSDAGRGPAPTGQRPVPVRQVPSRPGPSTSSPERGEVRVTVTDRTERSVLTAPRLDGGDTVAGRQGPTNGSASIGFGKGGKGDALVVAVRCEGRGSLYVAVRSVGASFPLECRAGRVNSICNEMALTGADRGGTVSVEAPSAVRWSLTVGRTGHPAVDTAGTGRGGE